MFHYDVALDRALFILTEGLYLIILFYLIDNIV
jgi:hypothetical protein